MLISTLKQDTIIFSYFKSHIILSAILAVLTIASVPDIYFSNKYTFLPFLKYFPYSYYSRSLT